MKSKLTSRKFWMALIGAALLLLNQGLDLDIDSNAVLGFAGIVMSYLVSQGWVDGKEKERRS